MRLALILTAAGGIAAGFLAARLTEASPTAPAVKTIVTRVLPAPPASCPAGVSPEDLAVLREQIVARLRPADAPAAPVAEPQGEEERARAASLASADTSAAELVENGIARATWTAENATELRRLFPAMSDGARRRLMSRLVVAINEQRLPAGPPF